MEHLHTYIESKKAHLTLTAQQLLPCSVILCVPSWVKKIRILCFLISVVKNIGYKMPTDSKTHQNFEGISSVRIS